jgi:hypothetical protein
METTASTESTTWLDRLPTEIVFMIFEYLSNNDIIIAFFHFSERFNNFFLQNERYSNYLELPTRNLSRWKTILSVIRSRIESLNITSIDLSFPLTYFLNLKSLIISSSHGFPTEYYKQFLIVNYLHNYIHSK